MWFPWPKAQANYKLEIIISPINGFPKRFSVGKRQKFLSSILIKSSPITKLEEYFGESKADELKSKSCYAANSRYEHHRIISSPENISNMILKKSKVGRFQILNIVVSNNNLSICSEIGLKGSTDSRKNMKYEKIQRQNCSSKLLRMKHI